MISCKELSFHYQQQHVLNNIEFTANANQLLGIVGPNGCGKSTLLKLMAGHLSPHSGHIETEQGDLSTCHRREKAKQVAYLPQYPLAPKGLTVEQLLRFGRHPHQTWFQQWQKQDSQILEDIIERLHLSPLLKKDIALLSGGQRQKAWLGMTLAQDTPVILLDEPTSALDIGHQVDVMESISHISRLGKTVVLVIHDLAMAARYCDRILAIHSGSIKACGEARTVISAQLVHDLYGTHVDILAAPQDQSPVIVPRRKSLSLTSL
ncbi:Ferrichrome transport ATP-binding protein FhuC (TC 3.A.1.14.3) [Pseudoalteromonas luteoviolacea B = ATCC 29581]|nr:Ferrichrome transport ATP-binding protein FhuC (TC 3.A.1.14.3) [Pseudoalteromonas luteoviolacea B = ATCC 29581]